MNRYIECLISLPKSLYVSIKLMGLKRGLKIPILVKYNVKLLCLTGKVVDMGGGEKLANL